MTYNPYTHTYNHECSLSSAHSFLSQSLSCTLIRYNQAKMATLRRHIKYREIVIQKTFKRRQALTLKLWIIRLTKLRPQHKQKVKEDTKKQERGKSKEDLEGWWRWKDQQQKHSYTTIIPHGEDEVENVKCKAQVRPTERPNGRMNMQHWDNLCKFYINRGEISSS